MKDLKPKEKIFYYNTVPRNVQQAAQIKTERFCNGFTAINIGATVATVNGVPLNPPAAGEVLGDSYNDGGNKGEIFIGRIDIAFASNVGANVLVIQKIYIPHYGGGDLEHELNAD